MFLTSEFKRKEILNLKGGLSPSKFAFTYLNGHHLKLIQNTFYFMLKAFLILEIFTFSWWFFGFLEKWLDNRAMVDFKTYYVTERTTNNYNIHIAQYPKN